MIKQSEARNRILIVLMLLVFIADTACPIIILPLFHMIGLAFDVSHAELKMSVGFIVAGVCLSQLLSAFFITKYNTKILVTIMFSFFLLGGITSFLSEDIHVFWLGEFFQGLGIGATYPIIQAAIKYNFDKKANAILAYIGKLPIFFFFLSPFVGSLFIASWRYVFSIIIVLAIAMLLLVFLIPNSSFSKKKVSFLEVVNRVRKEPVFLGYTLLRSFSRSGSYLFFIWSAILLVQRMGIRPHIYAYLLFFPTCALFLGGALNGLIKRRQFLTNFIAHILLIIAGCALIAAYLSNLFNAWTIIFAGSLYCFGRAISGTQAEFALLASYPARFTDVIMIFSSIIVNASIALLIFSSSTVHMDDGLTLGGSFLVCGVGCLIVQLVMWHRTWKITQ